MDSIATSAEVQPMDQATQQNATKVQQLTEASDSLAQEAPMHRELIAQFRLDDAVSHSSALRSTARTMAQPAARAAVHPVAARR